MVEMELFTSRVLLLLIAYLLTFADTGTIQNVYIRNNQSTIKGTDIQIVCDISSFSSSDLITLYKTDSRILTGSLPESFAQCAPGVCVPDTDRRYTFTPDSSHVYIDITNLNRSEDQKWWTCVLGSQRKDLYFTVYTVPQTLQFDSPPSEEQDLAVSSVTFRCSTECVYPQPSFSWFYTESGGSPQEWSASGSDSSTAGRCTDSEKIYTSTLTIAKYTTFTGNVIKTVKFTCGITLFTGMTQPLYTNPSVNVSFAVQVTSAELQDGGNRPSEPLQVTSGVSKTLTCSTSTSRPTPTIVWYIGTDEKSRSSSSNILTFTPQNSDHNKQIYCKAFNTQPESQAVSSDSGTLYVQVRATTPTLTNQTTGSLVMLENDTVSMECVSSLTRPVVIVTWKKGTTLLTDVSNTDNTNDDKLVTVRSVVTFKPNRNDDNKVIYCETAIPGQSNKPKAQQRIIVYWPPSTPAIPRTDLPFLEGQTGKTLSCVSTEYGNPASVASWEKSYGTPADSNSRILNLPKLTPEMDNSPVACQLNNNFTGIKNLQVISPTIPLRVEYTPVVRILEEGNVIENAQRNEGQRFSATCSADGNPEPTVKWEERNPASAELSFNDIDRSDDGTYTCRAEATSTKHTSHNFVSTKTLNIVINYAPDVSVSINISEPTENTPLVITCNIDGRPESLKHISMVQTWNGITIPNIHTRVGKVITIPNLQLQDSGIYTCEANNGIPDRQQQINQTGMRDIKIKVSPKVLLEGANTFAGVPGGSVNITVPFYSYPDIQSAVFRFSNGSEIVNSPKHDVSYMRQNVTDTFYGVKVELVGYIAVLHIRDEEESDFDSYTLLLDNGFRDPTEWTLFHVSEMKKEKQSQSNAGAVAIAVSCAVGLVFVIIIIVAVIWRKKAKNKDERSDDTNTSSTYESLHGVNNSQTTYSSLTAFSGNQKAEEEMTYENLRLNVYSRSSTML